MLKNKLRYLGIAFVGAVLCYAIAVPAHGIFGKAWYFIEIAYALLLVGIFLNTTVIALNRGMPIVGGSKTPGYIVMSPNTKLNILGDWIPTSRNYLISPGDLFIYAGKAFAVIFCFFVIKLFFNPGSPLEY